MNFYKDDPLIQSILKDSLAPDFFEWADKELSAFGEKCATVIEERARHTDREGQPRLVRYDAYGNEQPYVWVNEGYKQTVKETYNKGIVGYIHKPIPELSHKGNYLYSFAQGYLLSQTEPGFYCPVTLTMATAYLVEQYGDAELKAKYLPHILSTGDDELYEGATFLTEQQGGSDVGANETRAIYDEEKGSYRLYGLKYFASNAGMCGVAAVLARPEGAPAGTKGLSLFLVPWKKGSSDTSGIKVRRLKDKLGVRAVPSGEVEFEGAEAYMIGEKERGFYYMMEALNLSRICNAVASVGIMRRAYTESYSYASERDAFGRKLMDYPMIQDSLVKMNVKLEAEVRTVFELVKEFDMWYNDRSSVPEDGMLRLMIALIKAETAEEAIHFSHEAIEMHGGNGYIEDFVTSRLLRDAQVLTVWEGTANILGLEVLRLFTKFDAGTRFAERMEKELSACSDGIEKTELLQCLSWLQEEISDLEDMDEAEKTRRIKPLQKKMVSTLEAVTLLKAAEKSGNERSQKAAQVYVEHFLYPLWGNSQEPWSLQDGLTILSAKAAVEKG
ncbi:acyl-CoA dehydrogenase family protein [Bacillus sp. H-16]|uniref:acyl-CoA dehydrogenase family protein n=1 Tax=Alteribacter salitolerans TaxID=2912333 RepID=UPI001963F128|nr:acyl-CoA dehydrogenase family protein [Alteribacter salitolerans]MBM7094999.1 acyl-CoA dehydrogenase family protein [Alteribacter salitolerans]